MPPCFCNNLCISRFLKYYNSNIYKNINKIIKLNTLKSRFLNRGSFRSPQRFCGKLPISHWQVDRITSTNRCRARREAAVMVLTVACCSLPAPSCPARVFMKSPGIEGGTKNSLPQEDSILPLPCVALHIMETAASVMCSLVCLIMCPADPIYSTLFLKLDPELSICAEKSQRKFHMKLLRCNINSNI